MLTREPGGTELGERVRELVLHSGGTCRRGPRPRSSPPPAPSSSSEVIAPALARGADVVCDRYVDSSLAYQGIARGLGVERVLELNLVAVGGLLPDRTFLLLVDAREARALGDAAPTGSSARPPLPRPRRTRRTASSPSASRADRRARRLAAPDELAERIHGALRSAA